MADNQEPMQQDLELEECNPSNKFSAMLKQRFSDMLEKISLETSMYQE